MVVFFHSCSTVQCFRWKTRQCREGPEVCELQSWPRTKYNVDITATDYSASLLSPGYEKLEKLETQSFGKSFFCLYNVSLNCPAKSVIIRSTQNSNWARNQYPECNSYVAITANRNSTVDPSNKYCGGADFHTVLDDDSFLAIMWTSQRRNNGIFELDVRCNEVESFVSPPTTTEEEEEGSGGQDDIFTTNEVNIRF